MFRVDFMCLRSPDWQIQGKDSVSDLMPKGVLAFSYKTLHLMKLCVNVCMSSHVCVELCEYIYTPVYMFQVMC